MKKFLTKKATMIGSIVAAAVVFILLIAFCVRPVSVGYTYSGEVKMGATKFTAEAHINSFNQMTLTVYDEDGEEVKEMTAKSWYIEKDGYLFQLGEVKEMDKDEFKDAKEEFLKQWEDLSDKQKEEYSEAAGFKVNAFKAEFAMVDAEFTCGGAYATVVVLAVVDALLVAGAVASIVLSRKK